MPRSPMHLSCKSALKRIIADPIGFSKQSKVLCMFKKPKCQAIATHTCKTAPLFNIKDELQHHACCADKTCRQTFCIPLACACGHLFLKRQSRPNINLPHFIELCMLISAVLSDFVCIV